MILIFVLISLSLSSFADEGDPAIRVTPAQVTSSNLVEAGANLLVQHLNDKESLTGTCQILENAKDRFPRPCSMIKFLLSPVKQSQGRERSFQTNSAGRLSMEGLKSEIYQLQVTSEGYRLMNPEPVIVQRGQKILITLLREARK